MVRSILYGDLNACAKRPDPPDKPIRGNQIKPAAKYFGHRALIGAAYFGGLNLGYLPALNKTSQSKYEFCFVGQFLRVRQPEVCKDIA